MHYYEKVIRKILDFFSGYCLEEKIYLIINSKKAPYEIELF